ncbi:hypothetical protein JW898_02200 [Candidatus Woesearchaeota archaeon]|nr:hypothetical protein [Candidatus Woesearchaeota archaeon]
MDKSESFFGGNQGQVTIFIILGIVILVGVGAAIFLTGEPAQLPAEIAAAERIPDEFKPVKDFIESCLAEKLGEAFVIIGQHGGYLDMSNAELSGKEFTLEVSDPTSSDAAFLTGFESSHVPYWWHMQSDNKCLECLLTDENKPSLEFIMRQSDAYIEAELGDCVDGFRSFRGQGFDVIELGKPSAETTITEDDVVVLLTYPINVILEGRSNEMTRYFARIPLGFRDFYRFAEMINHAEIDVSFLEYPAKQIFGVYGSGADSGRLPPIYSREESYVPKVWSLKAAELNFRSLLTSHVPLLSINGTKNANRILGSDALTNGLYKAFYHNNLVGEGYDEFSVNFYYLDWPIYFYIGPGNGEMLGATRVLDIPNAWGKFTLSQSVPIREYGFFYDISYPIIVEVRRDSDLFGEGYSFFFAIESNIRDNRDVHEWLKGNGTYGNNVKEFFTVVDITKSELPETSEEAGMSLEESVNISRRQSKSLFCEPRQRLSGNVSFVATDAVSGNAVEGVKVKFGCGLYEFCSIGVTGFDVDTNFTGLVSSLPVCFGGGILKFEKDGYLDRVLIDLSVDVDDSGSFVVEMSPLVEKEVSVVKQAIERDVLFWDPYDNYGNDYTKRLVIGKGASEPDPDNDSLLVMIRKVDLDPLANFPSQIVSYDPSLNSSSIRIGPGVYEVKATFINTKGATIIPELRCESHTAHDNYESGADKDGCYFMPEDETVMQQVVAGGLELVNESGYWIVSKEQLTGDNHVVFRIFELPKMVRTEEMDEMGLIVNLSREFRSVVEPVFQPN